VRTVETGDYLSHSVVAQTVKLKSRLDKHWATQELSSMTIALQPTVNIGHWKS